MIMKRAILVWSVILFLGLPMSLSAQLQKDAASQQQRKAKFEQFCQFRRDYMQKQIGLTDQEAQQFFTLWKPRNGKSTRRLATLHAE